MSDSRFDPVHECDNAIAATVSGMVETLVKHGHMPETERARIHALTRKVTMSDEDLAKALNTAMPRNLPWSDPNVPIHDVGEFVKDLRDRYEERGKYAIESEPTKCGIEGCSQPATDTAFNRLSGKVEHACATHARIIAENDSPEYTERCANCGCLNPIN